MHVNIICYYINMLDNEMRKKQIKESRQKGDTYRKIGEFFNITRQRVHQIYFGRKTSSSLGSRHYVREKIRKRDNYTCQICGKVWEKGKRRLDVHHTDEAVMGKINTAAPGMITYDRNNSDKLITLCHKCHLGVHWGKNKLSTPIV